jgi:hypothetical protein
VNVYNNKKFDREIFEVMRMSGHSKEGRKMMLYRIAFCIEQVQTPIPHKEQNASHCPALTREVIWIWRSTILMSPHALLTLLRAYRYVPHNQIRIFFASSETEMDDMLVRQNSGQISTSVTADQFLTGKHINTIEVRRLRCELSLENDHDEPYVFELPPSSAVRLAWTILLGRSQRGELES